MNLIEASCMRLAWFYVTNYQLEGISAGQYERDRDNEYGDLMLACANNPDGTEEVIGMAYPFLAQKLMSFGYWLRTMNERWRVFGQPQPASIIKVKRQLSVTERGGR